MKPYDPEQQLSALVKKLEVGKYFAISVKQAITNYMMLYKGTTLIPNTAVLNNNINIYRHKRTIEKKGIFKSRFQDTHCNLQNMVTNISQGVYNTTLKICMVSA